MNEIEIISDENLPILGNEGLLALAERAEKQIEAIKKIKSIVLKVTNPTDWIDQNGKPYLQASGGEKVARIFGISWRMDEPTIECEPDGHFAYTYKGYFTLGGVTIEAIGTRSSKDGFFKKYGSDTNGEKITLPPSEIDKGDVKKSAFTNLIGNGITRLLGIRNLTWDEVTAGGIDKAKTAKVSYREKSNQDVVSQFSPERQDYHKRIEAALITLYGDDKTAKDNKLIELTTWTKNPGTPQAEVMAGGTDYRCYRNDRTVAILCSKLEKLVAKSSKEITIPERCSECDAEGGEHDKTCQYFTKKENNKKK